MLRSSAFRALLPCPLHLPPMFRDDRHSHIVSVSDQILVPIEREFLA
jgi:hypothetical protein